MRKFTGSLLAGVLGLSMIAGVSAQDTTGDASVCVSPPDTAGTIGAVISNADFGSVAYNASASSAPREDIVVTVTDTRGVVGSWSVTLSGTDFNTDPVALSFESESLSLTTPVVDAAPATGTFGPLTGGPVPTTGEPATTVITASQVGPGSYVFTSADSTLTVPAGTLVGKYKSTLTVTLSADNGNINACNSEVQKNMLGDARNW